MITDRSISLTVNSLIVSIFFFDYLSIDLHLLPRFFTWIPELLSSALLVAIFIIFSVKKRLDIDRKYLFLLFIFIFHLVFGALFNLVPAGAVFSGIRTFFRYLPLFLLPAVIKINEKVIWSHLKLVFIISAFQTPLSIYQRFVQFKGLQTGDVVSGTLTIAPFLTIFQIATICFLLSMFNNRKLNIFSLLFFCILLFIPCTLNETKAVVILLPAALLSINFLSKGDSLLLKKVIVLPSILCLMIAIFIPIYDHFIQPKWGYGIVDFFKQDNRAMRYLYKGSEGEDPSAAISRVDSMIIAFKHISEDPVRFIFGYGIGNIMLSFSRRFSGNHTEFDALGARYTTITAFLWETGTVGVLLLLFLFFTNFFDALSLQQAPGITGVFSLAWIGIAAMLFLSLLYVDLLHHNISFLIAYFAGYIAAEKYRFSKVQLSIQSS